MTLTKQCVALHCILIFSVIMICEDYVLMFDRKLTTTVWSLNTTLAVITAWL